MKFLPAEGSDLQLMHDRSLNFYRLFKKKKKGREIVFSGKLFARDYECQNRIIINNNNHF
jgi:hypothetical protein